MPILTGKTGEYDALRRLRSDVSQEIWPILDVPPYHPEKGIDDSLERLAQGICRAAVRPGRVAVDLLSFEGRGPLEVDHFRLLIDRARWNGVTLQLVLRTDAPDAYVEKVVYALPETDGLCIRARIDETTDAATVAAAIDHLLVATSVAPANTHIMFDCGLVADWARGPHSVVEEHLAVRSDLGAFRLVSMAATAVPDKVERDDPPIRVQRREWTSWRRLSDARIAFGDYGITGPRPNHPPQGRPDPHLRYTTDHALLIWFGRLADRATGENGDVEVRFRELCRRLIDDDEEVFAGAEFSDGDKAFAEITSGVRSRDGRSSSWVEWATSHHMTHVVRQLQSL